ncbi:GntR family transcriptional regulator [Bacillus sp. 1P06AnD]|uniref:GntR family transcriptional regulator n=1 Tax=Bacillus sp. 1P06AnD TaxID=3132208 RepID=UPI00399EE9B2
MKLELNNREPIYVQVITYFKEQLATGLLKAGDEIPSRRELAVTLNINPNTVQKAYKEMEDLELIQTERNFPSKVTTNEHLLQGIRVQLIQEATQLYIDNMKRINVPVDEVVKAVKQMYEKK